MADFECGRRYAGMVARGARTVLPHRRRKPDHGRCLRNEGGLLRARHAAPLVGIIVYNRWHGPELRYRPGRQTLRRADVRGEARRQETPQRADGPAELLHRSAPARRCGRRTMTRVDSYNLE